MEFLIIDMETRNDLAIFEKERAGLIGLAYRMLGSYADAEDIVQDVYIKWLHVDINAVNKPRAWLMTTCSRCCLDVLKSSRHRSVNYIGPWLPEPLLFDEKATQDSDAELSKSLSMAFLVILERLKPKERAAFLLREIFEQEYREIAEVVGLNEDACRKLVSRAKKQVSGEERSSIVSRTRKSAYVQAFMRAVNTGEISSLQVLLSEDVRLFADGGGKASALRDVLIGKPKVINFTERGLFKFWAGKTLVNQDINGEPGIIIYDRGESHTCVSFGYSEIEKISRIFITRNPEKLANLERAMVLS